MTNSTSERKFVVEGLIPANAITVFAGTPKVGKTSGMASLAHSLANGTEFMGLKTEEQHCHFLASEGKDEANLKFIACNENVASGDGQCMFYDKIFSINSDEGRGFLKYLLMLNVAENDRAPITIMIDNVMLFMEYSDSENYDYQVTMQTLRQLLKEYPEATFVVSDHSQRDGMPNVELVANADVVYTLTKKDSNLTITPSVTRFKMPPAYIVDLNIWDSGSHGTIQYVNYQK